MVHLHEEEIQRKIYIMQVIQEKVQDIKQYMKLEQIHQKVIIQQQEKKEMEYTRHLMITTMNLVHGSVPTLLFLIRANRSSFVGAIVFIATQVCSLLPSMMAMLFRSIRSVWPLLSSTLPDVGTLKWKKLYMSIEECTFFPI